VWLSQTSGTTSNEAINKELDFLRSFRHQHVMGLVAEWMEGSNRVFATPLYENGSLEQVLSHPTAVWSDQQKLE
jgi:hypothetical protein